MLIHRRGDEMPWEDVDWGDPAITVVARQKDLSEPGFLRLGMTLFEAGVGSYSTENGYDELYYFLQGAARFATGDEEVRAGAGDVVVVPKGTQVRVMIEEPMRTFCVGAPHWLAEA